MGRRILLVDDEVAVLLTLKAVLEISGFEVDTAASAREGVSKLHTREYQMLITDMRMEHDVAGVEVIKAARAATYHPAVALLTAFPVAEEDWQEMGADQLLVKPMHTRILLQQIEELITSHERKLESLGIAAAAEATPPQAATRKVPAKKSAAKKKAIKPAAKKAKASKSVSRKSAAVKKSAKKVAPKKKVVAKKKAASRPAKRTANKARPMAKKVTKTSSRGKSRVAARRKKS
jgi:DNA-binding response OmpR family regulator